MKYVGEKIEDFLPEVEKAITEESYNFAKCATALDRTGPYHKMDVIAAALRTGGDFGAMARLLSRTRGRVVEYVSKNIDVLTFVSDLREENLDKIEQLLMNKALNGDTQTGRFLLSTIGRERGYATRQEQTGKDGGPIERVDKVERQIVKPTTSPDVADDEQDPLD